MKIKELPAMGCAGNPATCLASSDVRKRTFSHELEHQTGDQQDASDASAALPAKAPDTGSLNSPAETPLVCLGTISKQTPTISHLLVRNPVYRNRCWELIYAAQNKDKPYDEIPLGKTIYLDPQKEEIVWADQETVRKTVLANDTYRAVADIKLVKSPTAGAAAPLTAPSPPERTTAVRQQTETGAAAGAGGPESAQSLGKTLVKKLRHFIGTPYKRLNCYELVVEGLRKMGIQYRGKDGLQQYLVEKAVAQQLPANTYFTGDGLIEASGHSIYNKSFTGLRQPEQKTEEIWNEIEPLLEPGLMVSFSTGKRGHTGIIARQKDDWTLINSGLMDNDIRAPGRRKRVGEERLKEEICNWLRLAKVRRKPLVINLGQLDEGKLESYQREASGPAVTTNL